MSFEVKSIGDVCSVGDGAHSKVTRVEAGIPYLTSKNIGQGFLKLDNLDYISEESFEKLFSKDSKATRRPRAGDVLFGIIGSFGNTYLYKDSDFFGFSSSIGILRPDPELLDSEFLYYVVSSKKFRDNHANHNSGSVQGYTNIPTVKGLPIPVPLLAVQKKIAKILKSLDRKITVNQQTNQTLEEMAQAIFKSWFVDFDPVKAKMNGEQPEGMDAATASLFPEKLVESEMGLIPEGWDIKSIKDFGKVITGKTPPKKVEDAYSEQGVPFVTPSDIDSDVFVSETKRFLSESGVETVKKNLLPEGSICVTCIGSQMGKAVISPSLAISNQQINSVVVAKEYERNFLFLDLRRRRELIFLIGSSGSTMPIINKSTFEKLSVLTPSEALIRSFDKAVSALLSKIHQNAVENQTLSELRDTLLPKLLSGEIDLAETTI